MLDFISKKLEWKRKEKSSLETRPYMGAFKLQDIKAFTLQHVFKKLKLNKSMEFSLTYLTEIESPCLFEFATAKELKPHQPLSNLVYMLLTG